jgi:hypothetical protein
MTIIHLRIIDKKNQKDHPIKEDSTYFLFNKKVTLFLRRKERDGEIFVNGMVRKQEFSP